MTVALADRAIGMLAGFALLWLIASAYRLLRGRSGMGGGDAPMLGAIGAWTGWMLLPVIVLLAASAGIAIAVIRAFGPGDASASQPSDIPSDWAGTALPLGTLFALAIPAALVMAAVLV